jgi:hypothetical protein
MERLGWRMDKYRKMKKVEIKDLQEGDEILVASGSGLRYLKVLKNPSLSNKKGWKKGVDNEGYFCWNQKADKYKALLCSTTVNEVTYKIRSYRANQAEYFKTFKESVYEEDSTKHNKRISIDLNYKDILLIKRREQ